MSSPRIVVSISPFLEPPSHQSAAMSVKHDQARNEQSFAWQDVDNARSLSVISLVIHLGPRPACHNFVRPGGCAQLASSSSPEEVLNSVPSHSKTATARTRLTGPRNLQILNHHRFPRRRRRLNKQPKPAHSPLITTIEERIAVLGGKYIGSYGRS